MSPVLGVTVRLALAALCLFLTACSGEEADLSANETDRRVKAQMDGCMSEVMEAVARTAAVDTASTEALNAATRTVLVMCGSQALESAQLTDVYHCTEEGCYDNANTGYSWERVAVDWLQNT